MALIPVPSSRNSEPLVSLIMPCFNSQLYISEAINSLLQQEYQNWECIVIDDGSIDESIQIIKKYVSEEPNRIKLLINPGKGACSARNFGMENSTGLYLKFLDSDDALYDSQTLKIQVEHLEYSGMDIIFGNEIYYKEIFDDKHITKVRGAELNEFNIDNFFFYRYPITSNFLLRGTACSDIRWNQNLRSGQELHFLFCCFMNGLKFSYQDIPMAKIRQHDSPDRISNKRGSVFMDQTLELIKQLSVEINRLHHHNTEFEASFNFWKLRWIYNAISLKNYSVSKAIQETLIAPREIKVRDKLLSILYRINYQNAFIGYFFYKTYKRLLGFDFLQKPFK